MGKLIFITGGVRSGKSSYAERLAAELRDSKEALVYLACGVNTDHEMERRILKHQLDREATTEDWITIECPRAIGGTIDYLPQNAIVLLDCLTTLLTNEMFVIEKVNSSAVEKEIYQSIIGIRDKAQVLLVVSNELFYDIPLTSDIVQFQKTLGSLHRRMVEESSTAIDMSVGIPVVKKGIPIS
ncbi:bifunctional adenosylcobinamide kinase/adenosylcobinamide-phosphate guanylyltransferase [Bacillus sp. NTK074B]|uniref:bifunctional adenosylcobinamide kinase/adenosylcobinamide-phosphate guanylyltransferase n=1 Tax=Bacillus sp. NTK074B TaxID=2802174 RepID=UPI001A8EDE94